MRNEGSAGLAHLPADVRLPDGGTVRIRTIRPDDRQGLREHFRALTPESVHARFHELKRELTERELSYYTDVELEEHVGLVATVEGGKAGEGATGADLGSAERILGVGRYIVLEGTDPPRAEVAFAVLDEHQGRGIGTALFDHLLAIARRHGLGAFEAVVLPDNRRMLRIFEDSGLEVQRRVGTGAVHVIMPLGPSD